MAAEKPTMPGSARKRRRHTPTIDLTATEVAGSPAEIQIPPTSEAAPPSPVTPPAEGEPTIPPSVATEVTPGPEPQKQVEPEFISDGFIPADDPPAGLPPRSAPAQRRDAADPAPAFAAPDAAHLDEQAGHDSRTSPEGVPEQKRTTSPWGSVAAGLAGGVLVSLVLFALWFAGAIPARQGDGADVAARIQALDSQIRALRGQPAAGPVSDMKAVDALAERLTRMEVAVASPRPPAADPAVTDRVAAVETGLRAVAETLAALDRRAVEADGKASDAQRRAEAANRAAAEAGARPIPAPVVGRADIDAISKRIATLENSAGAIEGKIARAAEAAAAAPDSAARFALAAAALRDTIARGAQFPGELAAVRALGGDEKMLALLAPFAPSGIVTDAALARELQGLVPALLKASGPSEGGVSAGAGFLERLQANAGKIVRVRPAGEASGDEPAAIAARIELKAARSDIPGALEELNRLPAAQRSPAENWMRKAEARRAALEASRKIVADAVVALAKPAP